MINVNLQILIIPLLLNFTSSYMTQKKHCRWGSRIYNKKIKINTLKKTLVLGLLTSSTELVLGR
jgi:hypothetical protein